MITYVKGNIFESKAEVLVNPTNCQAVMGAGLALAFSRKFPGIEIWYKGIKKNYGLSPGDLYIWPDSPSVLCFPTKNHWKLPSEIDYIAEGLMNLVGVNQLSNEDDENFGLFKFSSIAFPRLGCGLGGLNWNEVKDVMEEILTDAPFNSYIYE